MRFIKSLRNSLSFNIISSLIILLVVFSWIVTIIGYISFSKSLEKEYDEVTYGIAQTAATLVNGDHIDAYLNGQFMEEHDQSQQWMDTLCDKMDVSIIYVIKPDKDYKHFTSVFNSVNKDTGYTPWEIGYRRNTTNEEYEQKYEQVYLKKADREKVMRTKDLDGAPPHITSILAINNAKGDVTALMCVQRPMTVLSEGRAPYITQVTLSVLLTVILVSYMAINYLKRQFINPIHKISQEADRFARENEISNTDMLQNISKINEIKTLATSISQMELDTLKYFDDMTAALSEKQRIDTELDVAAKIQAGAVPSDFPAYPERTEFDIYASMTPAKEVGGDFYDFFAVDDDHIALVMADVSGKGIPAALFMMVTKMLIKIKCTTTGGTPAEIIEFVNDRICSNNSADMFVTIWFGILELSTGKITCVNAGHDDPVIYRKGDTFNLCIQKHGLVVGAMEGVHYTQSVIQLQKGDKLFLYTDGVPEATDKNDTLFGCERMLRALHEVREQPPKQILEHVKQTVDDFVGEAPQFDDITMLCLEYYGAQEMEKTLHIEANNDKLDEVTDFVSAYLEQKQVSLKVQMQIALAVEEIFVNIANYAYQPGSGYADVKAHFENDVLTLIFEDSGVAYNPLAKKDPDITLPADERQIGGLGIFMTKKIMDDVAYDRKDDKNILTLKKKID